MSCVINPVAGKPYGVERVCHAWGVPRSSYYAALASFTQAGKPTEVPDLGASGPPATKVTSGTTAPGATVPELAVPTAEGPRSAAEVTEARDRLQAGPGDNLTPGAAEAASGPTAEGPRTVSEVTETRDRLPASLGDNSAPCAAGAASGPKEERGTRKKRGPRPAISDDELLALIREDLETSCFRGEGHRKVWARLRQSRKKVRVGCKRVLRLMRENHLLSPHRSPPGDEVVHDGRITTDAPNVMWGTDAMMVLTRDQGWVWVFTAVDHWNAECVGFHVSKEGRRFEALQAVSMGLAATVGAVGADVGRGLALRMDHGPQFISHHYLDQIRYWGIAPSYALVSQPQTNGVAERFNRTLREQVIAGRVFSNAAEVRAAIGEFVDRYNREWLVEKNGFLSPLQARQDQALRRAA